MSPEFDIEGELTKLWSSMAEQHKMRACLFTLVMWCGHRQEYFQEVAQNILNSFPCRLLFVTQDQNDPQALQLKVSMVSANPDGSGPVCDRIDLHVGSGAEERLPSLLLPRLIPDLPVYLVWGDDPCLESPLLGALRPYATKLIFDSEMSSGLQRFAQKLLQLLGDGSQAIADLNWVRTEPWRDLLARTFADPAPLQALTSAQNIRILYNSCLGPYCHHSNAQAIYLQGWLASQLRWGCGDYDQVEEHQRVACQTLHGEVIFLVLPELREGVPEGQVSGIEISCREGRLFRFLRRDAPGFVVDLEVEYPTHCEMPVCIIRSAFERGHSLASEVFSPGTNPHFVEMLHWLSRVASS